MEEQFVPYEQALELKELGFDEECFGYYYLLIKSPLGIYQEEDYSLHSEMPNWDDTFGAPLWQQSFDFLRDKYGLQGVISYYEFEILDFITDWGCIHESESFSRYKETKIACLTKLIELCKNRNHTSLNGSQ